MNDNLSRAASAIWRLAQSHREGAAADAGFDGGEWSAREHDLMEASSQHDIAEQFGFQSAFQLWNAIEERTSARWVHECFPPLLADEDEYERDSIHGRNRNR